MKGDADRQMTDDQPINRPAVGLCVRGDTDPDALAGAILRAHRQRHDVYVATNVGLDHEALTVAEQLETRIVDLDRVSNGDRPRGAVAARAREAGFPGLVWVSEPSIRVDFERSVEALRAGSEYCVDTARQPAVDPEPRVLVAIPAYNEADTIVDVVADAALHAEEVFVVDDGSDDDTATRGREAGATVIEHDSNRGYGAALKTAFREADRCGADHLVILDGDGQHDPADVPALVAAQRDSGAELVVGSRFHPDAETNPPLYRRIGLGIVNVATNLSMGVARPSARVSDTQCGFRAYDRQAIASLANDPSIGSHMGASTDILHHARARGYDVVEVPTTVRYDVADASTRSPVDHGITLIMNLVRTVERERPISVIGVPGFVCTLVGLGLGYWTFVNYVQTGSFPLGAAVTASFFGLVGVFACFTAIILHAVKTQLEAIE